MKKFIAAAVQLNSTENKKENLEKIALLVKEAAKKGAKLVALPKNTIYGFIVEAYMKNAAAKSLLTVPCL